jgi:hypothetical protein
VNKSEKKLDKRRKERRDEEPLAVKGARMRMSSSISRRDEKGG